MYSDSKEAYRILILKADRCYASLLREVAQVTFPGSAIDSASGIAEARSRLRDTRTDLLLSGVTLQDGDLLELLAEPEIRARPPRRLLVVTSSPPRHVLERLEEFGVSGVFDTAHEDPEDLTFALLGVSLGLRCWSQNLLRLLSASQPGIPRLARSLTATERLILATIGDGCDDETAAERLGLKATSVQSMRRRIHLKLGVQQRGDLVRIAALLGCVRFTSQGVVRPGYAQMLATYRATKRAQPVAPARRIVDAA